MTTREPMKRVEGLKKPDDLPGPTARPRTLAPVPAPPRAESEVDLQQSVQMPITPVESQRSPKHPAGAVRTAEPDGRQGKHAAKQSARRPKVSSTAQTIRSVSVSVPFTVAEAWRERARIDRTSQVDVLLDAIVANQNKLSSVISAASTRPTVTDGLFERGTSTGERSIGVSLRIKSTNLTVIDNLAETHGPVKRSPFVTAVLKEYLNLTNQ